MKIDYFSVFGLLVIFLVSLLYESSASVEEEKKGPKILHGVDNMPSSMPTEQQAYVQEQYTKFMSDRKKEKAAEQASSSGTAKKQSNSKKDGKNQQQQQQQAPPPPPKGISPRKLGMHRVEGDASLTPLTSQVMITGGSFWFGSQLDIAGKLSPKTRKDGADPKKHVTVKSFAIDVDCVTNRQFEAFVRATNYVTEAELYGWSFVFQGQASEQTIAEVDGETGYGRVKEALHWMAVANASWHHPFGLDRSVDDAGIYDHPVIQVSHGDAVEYCAWAGGGKSIASGGLRLLSEKEWEYAARSGRVNQSYPWGDDIDVTRMNVWGGPDFPNHDDMVDGYSGIAPVNSFSANDYGVHNMLGNVWEWVSGGKASERILRGGSFIDSIDGSYNHMVLVSTRQLNSGDSAGSNIGFRCGRTISSSSSRDDETSSADHIEL